MLRFLTLKRFRTKRKLDFLLNKSEKKLTVPKNPKISNSQHKEKPKTELNRRALQELDEIHYQEMLNDCEIQSIEKTPFNRRKSNRFTTSGNTSTNTSKTRGNSQVGSDSKFMKGRSSYTPSAKQIQVNKVGTHSDNFLMSFVSLRESEKKRPPKARRINKTDEEAWFTELTNISFSSEISQSEIEAIINEFIPEYSSTFNLFDTEKRVKPLAKSKTLNEARDNSSFKLKPKHLKGGDKAEELEHDEKDENEYCNIAKWTLGGVDAMIIDIKQELGLDDSFVQCKEDHHEFEVFSDDEVELNDADHLGLDKIDQYINQDIISKDKCLYEQKVSKIPKFGERSKISGLSSK